MANKTETKGVTIAAPNFKRAIFKIKGTVPFQQLRFSQKTNNAMLEKMATECSGTKKAKRAARDYDEEFKNAMYLAGDSQRGIPCTAFRNAMISACRTVNFKMTIAKLSIFCEADGFDNFDQTPLVFFRKGSPEKVMVPCRNANGALDIRTRAQWNTGWEAEVKLRWDGDQFSVNDVCNLLMRAGMQVGVGEGRPDGRDGFGMGLGMFEIVSE